MDLETDRLQVDIAKRAMLQYKKSWRLARNFDNKPYKKNVTYLVGNLTLETNTCSMPNSYKTKICFSQMEFCPQSPPATQQS